MKCTDSNNLCKIVERLSHYRPVLIRKEGIKRASVALILRNDKNITELLFIQRAESERDPWSGQVAFPGGGAEKLDASLEQTAIRESLEEIGVSLSQQMILGQLDDLQGSSRSRALNLAISCFVFHLDKDFQLVPNYEVADAFWVPLNILADPANQTLYKTEYRSEPFPATALGQGNAGQTRILWGLTYRFVQHFLEVSGVKKGLVKSN